MKRNSLLLFILIPISLAAATIVVFTSKSLSAQTSPHPTSKAGAESTLQAEVDQAIRTAIQRQEQDSGVPILRLSETQIDHIRISDPIQSERDVQPHRWATAWLTPLDAQSGNPLPTEPGMAIAQYPAEIQSQGTASSNWQVFLPSHPDWADAFQQALVEAPDLLNATEQQQWTQQALPHLLEQAAPARALSGYRLPWAAGEVMYLSQSVSHDRYTPSGSAHFSFDFAKPGYPNGMFDVYAAKAGTVYRAVWNNANGNESSPNYLVLEDPTTVPTTYQLYLHLAQDSIPVELRQIGTTVAQGQLIGVADDTGVSSGNHLHFHVHTNPNSYWGSAVDITFDDVDINGGRPRTDVDLPYCDSDDICDTTQYSYISGNIPMPDDDLPTGGILEPLSGATIETGILHISGWGSDQTSGLGVAQIIARGPGGDWQTIGGPYTSSPFSLDWDMCASQMPDGPISLALRLRDRSLNQNNLAGLIHFTKNFTCPTPTPACTPTANQIALFAESDYGLSGEDTNCVTLNTGTYQSAASLGSIGDNNVASILVGNNVEATLFSENNLTGRSETFFNHDANLEDNRLTFDTMSSLLVQWRTVTPQAPTLISPANAAIYPSGAALSLAWRDNSGGWQFQARLVGAGQTITSPWQTQTFWHINAPVPGSYTWQARARGPSNRISAWSSSRSLQIQTAQIAPVPPLAAPYTDTIESSAPGWSHNNTWAITDATNHTPSGSFSWRYAPGALSGYDTGSPNAGYLVSPPITLPIDLPVYLNFWYQYETETPYLHWDQRWVQISSSGGPFTNLLQLSEDASLSSAPGVWLHSPAISLADYAGQAIRIRFYFATLDSANNAYAGWFIDDFSIHTDPPPNCQDADNTFVDATLITYDSTTAATICPAGDRDYFKFQALEGDHVGIRVEAQSMGSPLDSFLTLYDIDGASPLAENDDRLLYQFSDSYLSFWFQRTGLFYLRLRPWDYPTSGGPAYTYTLNLIRDQDKPAARFLYPNQGNQIPFGPLTLSVAASDPSSAISHVEFYWHPANWYTGEWINLGQDWNAQDGWNYEIDTTALFSDAGCPPPGSSHTPCYLPYGIAFYARAYDWANNWVGTGVWNLRPPGMYLPLLRGDLAGYP